MLTKKYLIATFLLFSIQLSFSQDSNQEKLGFIRRSTIKIDSTILVENNRQFLSHELIDGSPLWFDGDIKLKSGYRITGLKLKFNLFDNSIYLNDHTDWRKVSNSAIVGFTLHGDEGKMIFRKGYGLPYLGMIQVVTTLRHQDIMNYLRVYPDYDALVFNQLNIEKGNTKHRLSIGLETKSSQTIHKLRNYLVKHEDIENVDSEYLIPELNENTYVEVLFETKSFAVIKHHFKKVAQIGSVSLSQHKGVFMFDEKDYYMSGKNKILTEFLFNKISINKAFYNSKVENHPRIRNVGSEKKLMNWLRQNYNIL